MDSILFFFWVVLYILALFLFASPFKGESLPKDMSETRQEYIWWSIFCYTPLNILVCAGIIILFLASIIIKPVNKWKDDYKKLK